MRRIRLIVCSLLITIGFTLRAGESVTIEQCVRMAQDNYPLIKKYELLEATKDIELSDINRSWLPRLDIYGQVTGQNVVPSFPDALSGVLQQMGQSMKGLGKVQYKVGADVSQTIWDGGVSSVRRETARCQEEVHSASLDVELYAVRERVENLYFAILLTEQQIAQNEQTLTVLNSNLSRLNSMLRHGTAMQSDVDMVEAQALTVSQAIHLAHSAVKGYRKALSLLAGDNLADKKLTLPEPIEPLISDSDRSELRLFDTQIRLNSLTHRMTEVSLRPKIGFFAQAYYGYPGLNYFRSMMNRDWSLNIVAGLKVSWTLDSFYTRGNADRRMEINARNIQADRELFLFNTNIQMASQRENIEGMKDIIKDDSRIVTLRVNVRKAAESQLSNGVIDTNALITKISDENMARLAAQLHEIQLLQEIYKLKYTLNR